MSLRPFWLTLALLCVALVSCSYDWDRLEPGTGADAGGSADGAPPGDATPDATPLALVVEPVYPSNTRWNDYVRNDDPTRACDGTETGDYFACIHAGERRRVPLPGRGACDGLTIAEALDAFEWQCLVTDGTATFYTQGLRPERGLADLIEATRWRQNHVTVHDDGSLLGQSQPATWWTNPVEPLPENAGAGVRDLDGGGTVYVLEASRLTDGYRLVSDAVAMVALDGATLGWASTPGSQPLVLAPDASFLWIEVSLVGGGLQLTSARFSQVRRTRISGARDHGLLLSPEASHNYVYDLESTGSGGNGVYVRDTSSYNTLERIVVHGNTEAGLACYSPETLAAHNTYRNIVSHGNGGHGVSINARCPFQKLRDVLTHGNADRGLWVNSSDVSIARVVAANNALRGVYISGLRVIVSDVVTFNNVEYGFIGYGIDSVFTRITSFANGHPIALWDGTGITLSHVTTANNAHHGVWSYAVPNVTAVQILAVNNAFDGVQLDAGATGGVFAQTAVSDNLERGVGIDAGSTGHRFTSALLVGPQGLGLCAVGSGGEGLVDGSCSDTGIDGSATYGASASDAVLRIDGIGASGSLVGAVIDDTRNTSHTMGLRAYGSIDDWVTFENRFRGWGRQSTDPFPGASHVGRCDGGSCRIWDLRLRGTDTVFRNTSGDGRTPNEPFVASAVCPGAVHGDRALSDRLTTPNTFLVNALEVLDDGIGDDDGLCESSEACIYSPNFGAYQGEGDYVAGGTCDFADGIVSDVTMYAHPLNGG